MSAKSGYFFLLLLVVNPFMLLFFQNCSSAPVDRRYSSLSDPIETARQQARPDFREVEISFAVSKDQRIK